jgi:hypothetical protein
MDKTRLSDWEESKPRPALVPTDLGDSNIHHPVNRPIRYQMLLSSTSASGDAYFPLIVYAKESASQVLDMGIRNGIDLWIRIAQSPYVTKEISLKYVRDAVVPTVEANRNLPGCQANCQKSSVATVLATALMIHPTNWQAIAPIDNLPSSYLTHFSNA